MFCLLELGVWPECRKIFCFKRCLSQAIGAIFKQQQFPFTVGLKFGKKSDNYHHHLRGLRRVLSVPALWRAY
jgi:hypothetical protein